MTPGTHCSQQDPADILYIVSLEDLNALHDYLTAAIAGNDLSEIPRLWNQQIGIIRSRPHDTRVHPAASASPDALEQLREIYVKIHNTGNCPFSYMSANGCDCDCDSAEGCGVCVLDKAISEIRQQQPQERDTP